MIPSAILLTIMLIFGILDGHRFNTISTLILEFGYYFVVIALPEEIIFRGFIQTRIYGIIKNHINAVLITAFMFMTMHIPFQMGLAKMRALMYIANNYIKLIRFISKHSTIIIFRLKSINSVS